MVAGLDTAEAFPGATISPPVCRVLYRKRPVQCRILL